MTSTASPAIEAWMSHAGDEILLIEVRLRRSGAGFHLRHAADDALPYEALRELPPEDLRTWAQLTEGGGFRPNKFAPGLRRGWRSDALDASALEIALQGLYPGAVDDWFSVREGTAVVTSFREFTSRQTGMYRNAGQQSDEQASATIRAGCSVRCCRRQRLWTVDGLAPDPPGSKSEIPCLEPCALMLEFARRTVRQDQEERVTLTVSSSELATLQAAVARAVLNPDPNLREGDTSAPGNLRRMLLLTDNLNGVVSHSIPSKEV